MKKNERDEKVCEKIVVNKGKMRIWEKRKEEKGKKSKEDKERLWKKMAREE